MKRALLMFSAIVSFAAPAAMPLAAAAQERPSVREDRARGSHDRRGAESRPERREGRAPERQRDTQPRQRSDFGERRPDQSRPDRSQRPVEARPQTRPDREGSSWQQTDRAPRPQRPADQSRPQPRPDGDRGQNSRPTRPPERQPERGDRPAPNNRWDSHGRRPQAGPDRGRYSEFHRNWNRDNWRRDWDRGRRPDWWRHDNRFRGWSGIRVGFYFAPGYGYYSVPRSYWNRQWYVGQFLPDIFWRYRVNDYRTYGLGYPPPGTRWVYVDNSIYLIDEYDGYIVEVIRDAWRW